MSESFPISNEHTPPSPHEEYIDVRETEEWEIFLDGVRSAEETLSIYDDPADAYACELSAKLSIELCEKFGYEYNGQPSRVVGFAYNDMMREEDTFFDASYATFHGCDLKFINNRWQAALEFYSDGTDNDLPAGSYYVPVDPRYIFELRIRADYGDDEDGVSAVQSLHMLAEAAQSQVASEDFTGASAAAQREILQNMCDSADSDLPHEIRDCDVVVDCRVYYTRYDDMPGFDLKDFKTNRTDDDNADLSVPMGVVEGFAYPELETISTERTLIGWDFDLGVGAPCLVLRNENRGHTYYIPPMEIEDIV